MVIFSFVTISELEMSEFITSINASIRLSWVSTIFHCLFIIAIPTSYFLTKKWWLKDESKVKMRSLLEGTKHEMPSHL